MNAMRVLTVLLGWGVSAAAAALDLEALVGWERRVELGTTVSGVVAEVAVRPGQRVEAGELLVGLDQRYLRARLEQAQAAVEEALQQREEARRERGRAAELYDRTVLSERDRTLVEIQTAAAEAAHRGAEAALAAARLDLEYSEIRAPFAGVVVAVSAQAGQALSNRLEVRPLVVLADDSRWRARALVGADRLAGLQPSARAEVAVAGEWYPAELLEVGLEPVERTEKGPIYAVEAHFAAPGGVRLRAGLSATVRIQD